MNESSKNEKHVSYVYDGAEVVLTGREAIRNTSDTPPQNHPRRVAPKIDILVEIRPKDAMTGTWTKWVHMRDLYAIRTN